MRTAMRRARRATALTAVLLVPIAAVVVGLGASAASAETCTGDTPTQLELLPLNAVAPIGDTHTVTAKETCGKPGSGDTLRFTIRGTNPQDAEGITDADGVLTYSYWDDNGAGADEIRVCTTGLTKNVCTTSTVVWQCGAGLFPNGGSCSRIPEIDLGDLFADRFADFSPGLGSGFGGLPVGALPTGFSPFGGFGTTTGFADATGP